MRNLKIPILALLLLLIAAPALASDYYTYRDGFWWYGGVAYTRQAVRCWNSHTGWCWKYFRADPGSYNAGGPQYITAATENWRSKLLDIAATRDKYEQSARASALEHNEFLEAVDTLGLKGNFALQGYGYTPQYASPYRGDPSLAAQVQQYGYLPNAQQGSTVYGYTELSQVIGRPVDLSAQLAKIERLTDRAIDLTDKTMGGHQQLVSDIGTNQARVAEIVAKGQATAQLLQSITPTPVETRTRTEFRSGTGQAAPAEGQRPTAGDLGAVIEQKCLKCHSGENPKGGVDMTLWAQFNPAQKQAVRDRLIETDPNKRMPLGPDNKPGKPLAWSEIIAFARE